ncbi:MAG: InlB B-repeat-containing protein [Bacilli bacterium]|nr:InlB B-repeat-containing protein [Bacilli bacterium]
MKEKKKMMIAIVLIVLLGILIFAIVVSSKGNSIKVTFDSHGGTEVESLKIKKGEVIEEPEEPLKEGYEFIGWYYDGKKFDFSKELDKNIKLEAKWLKVGTIKNTITFDSAGGSSVEAQKVSKGEKVKKPANPTRSGYTFVEWTLDGKSYDFNSKVEKSIKLVAVWKQNVVVNVPVKNTNNTTNKKPIIEKPVVVTRVYKVTFMDGNSVVSVVEVEEGKRVEEPSILSKENFEFKGWSYAGNVYDFTSPVNSNMTIEAIWSPVLKGTEKVDSSKLTDLDAVHNQNSIDVVKENNLITITKKAPLHSYLNDTETEEWILLILDFAIDPTTLASDDYEIKDTDINDAASMGATTDTAFVVRVKAETKEYTFKKSDTNEVVGTVSIVMDFEKVELNSVDKLASVENTDLDYNNQSITVSKNGNMITVKETRFLKGPGNTTEGEYGIVLNLGIKPNYITASVGTMDITETTKNKYQLKENEFVLWLKNDELEKVITFTNGIDSTNTLDITVKFEKATGVSYPSNGQTIVVLSQYDNVVKYYEDRNAFEIEEGTESFKFTVDGVEVIAEKIDNEWRFN